jgi:hypothetical protein
MGLRTVRLSPEGEAALRRIIRTTGLSISGALTRGLLALSEDVARNAVQRPYEIYAQLDLGPGGYAAVPSTDTRRGVRDAVRRKLGRQR